MTVLAGLFEAFVRHRAEAWEAPHARWGRFLTALSGVLARGHARARKGPVSLASLVDADDGERVGARLLGWLCDVQGEHLLGVRGRLVALGLAGLVPGSAPERGTLRVHGRWVSLDLAERTVTLGIAPSDRGEVKTLPIGCDPQSVFLLDPSALGRELSVLATEAAPEVRWLFVGWRRSLIATTDADEPQTMSTIESFSPDVTFLLEHWREYQELLAVKGRLEDEFEAMRERVFTAVSARWRPEDGWVTTLDEDWILLRRAAWPVPSEEWLAFVVVMTDMDALLTEGREGWFAALSMPTDAEFDGDAFAALIRARVDPSRWSEHLAARWPGYALGRVLPRPPLGAGLIAAVESAALAEFERLVTLAPLVDEVLRDLR